MSDPVGHPRLFLGAAHERDERRTRWVIALTVVTMVVEIGAGTAFGSMALLADGWHMAIVSLAAEHPRPPHHDKRLIHAAVGLSHLTVEVNPRAG